MSHHYPLIVHATQAYASDPEGAWACLEGLLQTQVYGEAAARTIVTGTLAGADSSGTDRLLRADSRMTISYSSQHGVYNGVQPAQRNAIQSIERTYGVAILYGVRQFGPARHEVILVDSSAPDQAHVNRFKHNVWQRYGLECDRYEESKAFNQQMAAAQPTLAVIRALGADKPNPAPRLVIAHDWAGMPLVFAAQLAEPEQWRSVFYAHETPAARRLIEERSGHDTAFYNAWTKGREWNLNLEAIYDRQDGDLRHAVLRRAAHCNNILAVGDRVVDEIRFLGGRLGKANIDLVYRGVDGPGIIPAEKRAARLRLQEYATALVGARPDLIFAHAAPLTVAKACWRDLRVLHHLDGHLRTAGKRAVLFLHATTQPEGRPPAWVRAWEEEYGWPVDHRRGNGDLVGREEDCFFAVLQPFNRQATNVQALLINQTGWIPEQCGERMPADMEATDIRRGSDLVFGQSVYEPFGAGPVEALIYGALACVSNACGAVDFVHRRSLAMESPPPMIVADYITLPQGYWLGSPYDALAIDQGVRDWVEENSSRQAASEIAALLAHSEAEQNKRVAIGSEFAAHVSWEAIARDFVLPALQRAA